MESMNLNHDKVWEDDALQATWREALDEYKRYHSVAKMKGSVEEIEAALEANRKKWAQWDAKTKEEETDETEAPIKAEDEEDVGAMDDVSASKSDETPSAENEPSTPNLDANTSEGDQKQQQGAQSSLPTPVADFGPAAFGPQTVLGTVKDDTLKKMLMSWYYAGYYTGLYEAQRRVEEGSEKP
ncbi:hypothetical protein V8F20_001122 [Naviculisporaceae sp. PSN 640]